MKVRYLYKLQIQQKSNAPIAKAMGEKFGEKLNADSGKQMKTHIKLRILSGDAPRQTVRLAFDQDAARWRKIWAEAKRSHGIDLV